MCWFGGGLCSGVSQLLSGIPGLNGKELKPQCILLKATEFILVNIFSLVYLYWFCHVPGFSGAAPGSAIFLTATQLWQALRTSVRLR